MFLKTKFAIGGGVLLVLAMAASIAAIVFTLAEWPDEKPNSKVDESLVSTFYGRIQGKYLKTIYNQKPYYGFQGIPYAKPPIGELRFKPPQRAEHWIGVLDAHQFGSECVQEETRGSEDCLFINVYTPSTNPNALLPVVIAIHGGTFHRGSANAYSPDLMLNEANIVVVTFNYRLGAFGFLSMDTPEYSGNMGLKDQLLAIKWTNENIYNFGGDNNKITLHGIGAGSVSVHMHMLSPASRGLFQRAILVSGTANNPWAVRQHSQVPLLQQLATDNSHNLNSTELITYLVNLDPYYLSRSIVGNFYISGDGSIQNHLIFAPVVEHPNAIEPFLLESPMKTIESDYISNVDAMFGVAFGESYYFVIDELTNLTTLNNIYDKKEVQFPLYEMNLNLNFSSEASKALSREIFDYYMGNVDEYIDTKRLRYNQMWSDIVYGYGIDRSVRRHAKTSTGNTYYYELSSSTELNIIKNSIVPYDWYGFYGATHGDELFYTFGSTDALKPFYSRIDINSRERWSLTTMTGIYTTFIIFGIPTTKIVVTPVQENRTTCLQITNQFVEAREISMSRRLFWERFFTNNNLW